MGSFRLTGGTPNTAHSWQPGILNPNLSWSHYRSLLRIGRQAARDFYEIEAVSYAWSVRELSRQIGSLLFDRLAKSRDKKGLMRLAVHGQEVAQPIDVPNDVIRRRFTAGMRNFEQRYRDAKSKSRDEPPSECSAATYGRYFHSREDAKTRKKPCFDLLFRVLRGFA